MNESVNLSNVVKKAATSLSSRSEGRGVSSFLGETRQVSDILGRATERSLVVLDEFGRGTATNDGTALACAVFQHVLDKVREEQWVTYLYIKPGIKPFGI